MRYSNGGRHWCTTVDDLEVARWTAATGGSTLVRLRLTNEGRDPIVARIVEEVPESVTSSDPITTTGDEIDDWRRIGDRVVHEFTLPVGSKRTSAYLLRSDDEPPVSLEPPNVHSIEPVQAVNGVDAGDVLEPVESPEERAPDSGRRSDASSRDAPREYSTTNFVRGTTAEEPTTSKERPEREHSTGVPEDSSRRWDDTEADTNELQRSAVDGPTGDGKASIVDDLLEALEADASAEQRRALRSELGASESERARLEHVQSRLDDLAAYMDALEDVIDVHGVDVVDDMRDSVDENASRMATLREDVAAIEDEVEHHREETIASLEAIEDEMSSIWSGLSDRLDALESELNATRSALTTLQEEVENDRQARAREVRRFDRSISEIEETLERLEASVDENDAFRRRFTAVFSSDSDTLQDDLESSEPVENDSTTDAD